MQDDKGDIQEPQDRRESVQFWLRWIKAAKKAAKQHWADARDAYAEYENKPSSEDAQTAGSADRQKVEKTYPIYKYSCKTIEPAYYARTPDVTTKRAFDIDDPISATGCLIVERFAEHLIKNSNFDDTMIRVVQDLIHADKATAQVVVEADRHTETERRPLMPQKMQDGTVMHFDGEQPYEGEVMDGDEGPYYEATRERAENVRIRVVPARFDRVLHTPEATYEDEITDKAYYFCLDYDEVCAKFPNLKPEDLPWKTSKNYQDDEQKREETADSPGRFLEGWECWSLKTKKVYYVCEGYTDGFLKDPDVDPYRLRGFFPSPRFILGSPPSGSLYPTPEWIDLKPTAELLHKCYSRIMHLVDGIRRRAIVDESQIELIAALNDLDGQEFITAKNMQAIVEKGGLNNLVLYVPVQELVAAISELAGLEDRFKANFYEWKGVPDILRGVADPVETAAAQGIKSGAANDRFKYVKKQIAGIARDLIEMMVDLGLDVYEPEELMEIVGYDVMQPQDQQNFGPALNMLKNDRARLIHIDIETDSTSFIDDQIETEKRQKVGELLIGGLDKIAAIAQTTPDFVAVALRVLLQGLEALNGTELEDDVKGAVNALIQKAQQPPPGPPPPDPIEQMKQQVAMQELNLKQQQLGIEQQKIGQKDAQSQRETELDARIQSFQEWFQTEKMNIERIKIGLDEREKLIEEKRLSIKNEVEAAKNASPRAVTINLGGGAKTPKAEGEAPEPPKKKRFTPVRDDAGNAVAWDLEDLPSV